MHWLDLSRHGLRMDAWRDGDGRLHTVLRGADACPEAATRLGYAQDGGGRWVRPGGAPSFGAVLREFPHADVAEVAETDVVLPLDAKFDPAAARPGADRPLAAAADFREARLAADGFDPAGFRAHLMAEGIPGEYRRAFEAAATALLAAVGRERFLALLRRELDEVGEAAARVIASAAGGTEAVAAAVAADAALLQRTGHGRMDYLIGGLAPDQAQRWRDIAAEQVVWACREHLGPRGAVAEFLAAGGPSRVAGNKGMLEYAVVHLREYQHRVDNALPPRPPPCRRRSSTARGSGCSRRSPPSPPTPTRPPA